MEEDVKGDRVMIELSDRFEHRRYCPELCDEFKHEYNKCLKLCLQSTVNYYAILLAVKHNKMVRRSSDG